MPRIIAAHPCVGVAPVENDGLPIMETVHPVVRRADNNCCRCERKLACARMLSLLPQCGEGERFTGPRRKIVRRFRPRFARPLVKARGGNDAASRLEGCSEHRLLGDRLRAGIKRCRKILEWLGTSPQRIWTNSLPPPSPQAEGPRSGSSARYCSAARGCGAARSDRQAV